MKNTKLRSLGMCVVSIMAILAHSALGQKRDAPTLNPPGVEVRVINTRAEAIPVTGTVNVGNLGSNPLPVTGTVDIGNLGTLRNADNPVFFY